MAISLPIGYATIDQLATIEAGRAYIAGRAAREGDPSPCPTTEPTAHYDVEMQGGGTHPECYIDVYTDGSAYIHSNADDEVWESLADYLAEYDLRIDGDMVRA